VSWHKRNPLGPIGIPEAVWNEMFEELEPIVDDDGTVLKRYKMIRICPGAPLMDGPICTQQRMDQLIHCELIERKPLPMPKAPSIFFMDYHYGSDDPESTEGEDPCE
jgi:hypothetical protein